MQQIVYQKGDGAWTLKILREGGHLRVWLCGNPKDVAWYLQDITSLLSSDTIGDIVKVAAREAAKHEIPPTPPPAEARSGAFRAWRED
jgi:hypothetical protein